MPGLREALADLAEEAHPYGDARDALRAARAARQRRRFVAPATVAAAVAAVVAVAVTDGGTSRHPEVPLDGVTDAPVDRLFPYPDAPVPLEVNAPPLPADAPVGAAALVRVRDSLQDADAHVVMPDGRQFSVAVQTFTDSPQVITLSPDGRLLAWRTADGVVVRDLSTTRQASLSLWSFGRWSANSRWLLAYDQSRSPVRLDAVSFQMVALPGGTGEAVLLDSGELLVRGYDTGSERVDLRVVDPDTGRTTRSLAVDPTPYLSESESVHIDWPDSAHRPLAGLRAAPGEAGLLAVRVGVSDEDASAVRAVLVFSTVDGRVLRRLDRPLDAPIDTPWPWSLSWTAVDGGHLVAADRSVAGYITIRLVDIDTGELFEVARLEYGRGGDEGINVTRGGTLGWGQ